MLSFHKFSVLISPEKFHLIMIVSNVIMFRIPPNVYFDDFDSCSAKSNDLFQ
jgi:hypothetical protein